MNLFKNRPIFFGKSPTVKSCRSPAANDSSRWTFLPWQQCNRQRTTMDSKSRYLWSFDFLDKQGGWKREFRDGSWWKFDISIYRYIHLVSPGTSKQTFVFWLFQLDDSESLLWKVGCFTTHPFKTGCLGFQVYYYVYLYLYIYIGCGPFSALMSDASRFSGVESDHSASQ